VGLLGQLERRVDLRDVPDVAGRDGEAIDFLAGTGGDGDAVAPGRQPAGDGEPDAAVSAGHENRTTHLRARPSGGRRAG
jgi:hypothetical protein